MGSKELADIITEILEKVSFKKKGSTWVFKNAEITKMVNLQHSNFSDTYYINYGYIINSLPLGKLKMHFYSRLGSREVNENEKIKALLDLDNNISDDERRTNISSLLQNNLLKQFGKVNTEDDLKNEFIKSENIILMPLVVKEYFNAGNRELQ